MRQYKKRTWSLYSWILMTFAFAFLGIIMLFATNDFAENFLQMKP